ncbi:MAG: gamma-glutamyltransferase [Thermoanaerobaculia bacterium]
MKTVSLTLFFLLAGLPGSSLGASRAPVRGRHGMVASVSGIASRIGTDVMKKGGNAVDAAVAVGLALEVVWPSAGNIGGGGFMLIRFPDGKSIAIDYRERAPLAATRTMYLDENGKVIEGASTLGYQGVGVPGTVAGFALANRKYGKLPWKELIEPAVRLARDGFVIDHDLAGSLNAKENVRRLGKFAESRRIFLRNGKPYEEGEIFRQPELAATLERIRDEGAGDFYEGKTAKLIVDAMKQNGGLITARDLATYEPTEREPLRGSYRGYDIITMPPPSSGGIVLTEMLNMLSHYDLRTLGRNSAASIHLLTEVMRRAYADRASYLGDTDFVQGVPVEGLMSPAYAAELVKGIDLTRATRSSEIGNPKPQRYESPDTTHYSVVDGAGTVVSNTYTLNSAYGSAVTVKGGGFLLNNEMDDFTSKPGVPNEYGLIQGEANSIAPRKRPLSSMTPTIVLKNGEFRFAVGSPGGSTIINTVLQVILNVVDYGMDIQQAVDAPRVHHQWMPDEIRWEPYGLNADTRAILVKMGHHIREKPGYIGDAEAVGIDPTDGMLLGASDPRGGGEPAGY